MVEESWELHGTTLRHPTTYRDGSSAVALFGVSLSAANAVLAPRGFRAAAVVPGRAAVTLAAVDYRDTDCGAYHEIALAFLVRDPRRQSVPLLGTWADLLRGRVATHTVWLPVTTELSRDAGVTLWGFPKTLAEIGFDRRDDEVAVTWRQDEGEVLRFTAPARVTMKRDPEPIAPPVLSRMDGQLVVSHLRQDYRGVGRFVRRGELVLGDHPIADELRALGLSGRPWLSTWNEQLHFEMSAPERC